MSVLLWTLPWHYLAAVNCLINGNAVVGLQSQPLNNLITKLNALVTSDPDELRRLLAPDQPSTSGAEPALFAYARQIAEDAGKGALTWAERWPEGLALRFRTEANDAYLSPHALVLPWPLPAVNVAEITTEAQKEHTYPAMTAGAGSGHDHNTSAGFPLRCYMKALDYLVDTSDGRDEFAPGGVLPSSSAAKAAIETRAQAEGSCTGVTYPAGLGVEIRDKWWTHHTKLEGYATAILLQLGWKSENLNNSQLGHALSPSASDAPLHIYQWPCGAFLGYQ